MDEVEQRLVLNIWEVEEYVYIEQLDDWEHSHLAFFFKKEDAVDHAEVYAGDLVEKNNGVSPLPEDREGLLIEEGDDSTWVYMGNPQELQGVNRPEGIMTYVYLQASKRVLEVK